MDNANPTTVNIPSEIDVHWLRQAMRLPDNVAFEALESPNDVEPGHMAAQLGLPIDPTRPLSFAELAERGLVSAGLPAKAAPSVASRNGLAASSPTSLPAAAQTSAPKPPPLTGPQRIQQIANETKIIAEAAAKFATASYNKNDMDVYGLVGAVGATLLQGKAKQAFDIGLGLVNLGRTLTADTLNVTGLTGNLAGLAGALGQPEIAQALGIANTLMDKLGVEKPDGLIQHIVSDATDKMAPLDPTLAIDGILGLDGKLFHLTPVERAALTTTKDIAHALGVGIPTATPPKVAPPSSPGVYVENHKIATLLTPTIHGTPLGLIGPGKGATTVIANGQPVWRVQLDAHTCQLPGPPPHGTGVVQQGATKTYAEKGLIARYEDFVTEPGGGNDPIVPSEVAEAAATQRARLAAEKALKALQAKEQAARDRRAIAKSTLEQSKKPVQQQPDTDNPVDDQAKASGKKLTYVQVDPSTVPRDPVQIVFPDTKTGFDMSWDQNGHIYYVDPKTGKYYRGLELDEGAVTAPSGIDPTDILTGGALAGEKIIAAQLGTIIKDGVVKTVLEDGTEIVLKEGAETVLQEGAETASPRNVRIVDENGSPLGEFDEIRNNIFIEEKSGEGLSKINPLTGLPFQDAAKWSEIQIYEKTVTRLENLAKASATSPSPGSSQVIPSLEEILNIKQLHFKIKSNAPDLIEAVETQLQKLRSKYPGWEFSASYGD